MRVTFVVPPLNLSGGIRVVVNYAKCLSAMGHEVTLVWPIPGRGPILTRVRKWIEGVLSGGEQSLDSEAIDRSYVTKEMHGCRLLECRGESVLASDVPDADVVVATWWTTVNWISSFPECKGKRVHLVQGDDTQVSGLEAVAKAAWRMPMARILVAPWLAKPVRSLLGDVPLSVVLNGVDIETFHAPPRTKQRRPRVGYMYSSLRIKGCDVIADALLRVRQQIPDLRILAFGAEIPSPEVPLVPGTEFTLRPPQESIRELYAACDVWVWGSRLEGFGLPIIEAMACRTPVVATDAGAAAALVAPGRGKLVPVQDSAAIASAVIEYCQMTADDWTKQSNAAYEFAQKRSLDVAAREFMTALESIVDGALTR